MNRTMHRATQLGVLLALAAGTVPAAGAEDRWEVKVGAVNARSTAGGDLEGSIGFGLGLEYRASRRIGVELSGLTSEYEDELEIDFFPLVLVPITIEQEFRATPILARLNFHATPGRRADLYFGPVAGYVRMSDITLTFRTELPDGPAPLAEVVEFEQRIETEDELAWGAHVGVDLRLGRGGSHLVAGATYLKAPLTVSDEFGGEGLDFDPLVFHLGYGFRF